MRFSQQDVSHQPPQCFQKEAFFGGGGRVNYILQKAEIIILWRIDKNRKSNEFVCFGGVRVYPKETRDYRPEKELSRLLSSLGPMVGAEVHKLWCNCLIEYWEMAINYETGKSLNHI